MQKMTAQLTIQDIQEALKYQAGCRSLQAFLDKSPIQGQSLTLLALIDRFTMVALGK